MADVTKSQEQLVKFIRFKIGESNNKKAATTIQAYASQSLFIFGSYIGVFSQRTRMNWSTDLILI